MKAYQFKNKNCPVCGQEVTPYSYVFDKRDRKVHLECAEKKLTPEQEDLLLARPKEKN